VGYIIVLWSIFPVHIQFLSVCPPSSTPILQPRLSVEILHPELKSGNCLRWKFLQLRITSLTTYCLDDLHNHCTVVNFTVLSSGLIWVKPIYLVLNTLLLLICLLCSFYCLFFD
jgi:hypothetical protein